MYKFPRDGNPSQEQDYSNMRSRRSHKHSRILDDTVPSMVLFGHIECVLLLVNKFH
mgnify:CR=1 FL=1